MTSPTPATITLDRTHAARDVQVRSAVGAGIEAIVTVAGDLAGELSLYRGAVLEIGTRRIPMIVQGFRARTTGGPTRLELRDPLTGHAPSVRRVFSSPNGTTVRRALETLGVKAGKAAALDENLPAITCDGRALGLLRWAAGRAGVACWSGEGKAQLGPPTAPGPGASMLAEEAWQTEEGLCVSGAITECTLVMDPLEVAGAPTTGADVVLRTDYTWRRGAGARAEVLLGKPRASRMEPPRGHRFLTARVERLVPLMVVMDELDPTPCRARLYARRSNGGRDGERVRLRVDDLVLAIVPEGVWAGEVVVLPFSPANPADASGVFGEDYTMDCASFKSRMDKADITTKGMDIHE
jgi:hypothetical protein